MLIPGWLQEAGAHERPWWLKTNEEAGRRREGECKYELPLPDLSFLDKLPRPIATASTEFLASDPGSDAKPRRPEDSRRRGAASSGAEGTPARRRPAPESRRTAAATGPPCTPTTHLRQLAAVATRPLPVSTCDEYNRCYYFPGSSLKCKPGGLIPPETHRGPIAKEGLGQRPKVFGSLDSDYGKAGRDIEGGWKLDAVRKSKSLPGFGAKPHGVNPSLVSKGITTSMVGGTNICFKRNFAPDIVRDEKRQVGLYEESFENWRGSYAKPEHGLSQSPITEFGGLMVQQKLLMRK